MIFSKGLRAGWRRAIVVMASALIGLLTQEAGADFSGIQAASAASDILRPAVIAVNVHGDVKDTRFLKALVRKLRDRLQPPVTVQTADVDLSPFRGWGKMDAKNLIEGLIVSVDWQKHRNEFIVLIIPDDMRLPPANYNFAASNGTFYSPHHMIVVSLARLQEFAGLDGSQDADPDVTAERVFKMIAKNVAKIAGYNGSNLCLFSFPRSLSELDATPEGFCEPDLSVLSEAGIARSLR